MKTASNIADRVEEYRYYSGYVGDVNQLSLRVLAVRLKRFHSIRAKENKANSVAGGPKKRGSRKRRRR